MLSTEQQERRKNGITSTDVAAILGVSPFRCATDVWSAKIGSGALFSDNVRTKWGNLLEPVVRSDYEDRTGHVIRQIGTVSKRAGAVTILATPDGIVEPTHGLEIKTHSIRSADYGRVGTDEVPRHVYIQCLVNMYVTGLPRWDVVAFFDGVPHDYCVFYNEKIADPIIEYCEQWWSKYVVKEVPPPPDGDPRTTAAIREMFRGEYRTDPILVEPSATEMDAILDLRDSITALERAEQKAELARQTIMHMIAGREVDGFSFTDAGKPAKITWRLSRDSNRTDHKATLIDYVASVAAWAESNGLTPPAVNSSSYTKVKPGSRRLTLPKSWSKNSGSESKDGESDE